MSVIKRIASLFTVQNIKPKNGVFDLIQYSPDGTTITADANGKLSSAGGGGGGGGTMWFGGSANQAPQNMFQPLANTPSGVNLTNASTGGVLDPAKLLQYPMPACTVTKLLIQVQTNAYAGPASIVVHKNGAPTAMTIAVGAGLTGAFSVTGSIVFAEGDTLDVVVQSGGDFGNIMRLTAVVKFS